MGVVAVPSELFASALTRARELEPDSQQELQASLGDELYDLPV
jgi:hypothetical protein